MSVPVPKTRHVLSLMKGEYVHIHVIEFLVVLVDFGQALLKSRVEISVFWALRLSFPA